MAVCEICTPRLIVADDEILDHLQRHHPLPGEDQAIEPDEDEYR